MRLVAPETITFTQSGFCPGWAWTGCPPDRRSYGRDGFK